MARNPWHDLHFTEARARAIVEATMALHQDWGYVEEYSAREQFVEQAIAWGLAKALAIIYPPSVRGAMGGHAKQRVLDARAAEEKARRLADRRRKARSRAAARERAAALRLHAMEQIIGQTRITR